MSIRRELVTLAPDVESRVRPLEAIVAPLALTLPASAVVFAFEDRGVVVCPDEASACRMLRGNDYPRQAALLEELRSSGLVRVVFFLTDDSAITSVITVDTSDTSGAASS